MPMIVKVEKRKNHNPFRHNVAILFNALNNPAPIWCRIVQNVELVFHIGSERDKILNK